MANSLEIRNTITRPIVHTCKAKHAIHVASTSKIAMLRCIEAFTTSPTIFDLRAIVNNLDILSAHILHIFNSFEDKTNHRRGKQTTQNKRSSSTYTTEKDDARIVVSSG